MAIIAATGVLTGLAVLAARPRLLVTAHDLRLRHRRPWRTTIGWTDVHGVYVIETANTLLTKRCSYLGAVTTSGPVDLWATMRPSSQIGPICQHVMTYAPHYLAPQPNPIGAGPAQ